MAKYKPDLGQRIALLLHKPKLTRVEQRELERSIKLAKHIFGENGVPQGLLHVKSPVVIFDPTRVHISR